LMKETAADLVERERLHKKAGQRLLRFVRRIEAINKDVAKLKEGAAAVRIEAKGQGYDAKALAQLVRDRARGADAVAVERDMLDLYAANVAGAEAMEAAGIIQPVA
jgi:uncharacterized protein (UPF0335 family)